MSENPQEVPGPSEASTPEPAPLDSSTETPALHSSEIQPLVDGNMPALPAEQPSEEANQAFVAQYPPLPEQYINMQASGIDPYGGPVYVPPPFQPGQPPYQFGQPPFQPGQPPYQFGQPPFQPGQPPYQFGQPPFRPDLPPGYGYGYYELPVYSNPLPLSQAIRELPTQYRRIVWKPGVQKFREEQSKAAWNIIWMQLLFLMIFSVITSLPTFYSSFSKMNSTDTTTLSNSPFGFGLSAGFLTAETIGLAVLVPVTFFIGVGIQYLMAKMFRGTGEFKHQAYNHLLFLVPTSVITSVIAAVSSSITLTMTGGTSLLLSSVISLLFSLVSFAISIYAIVLNVFSIMATHRLSGGKATGVVLIPYGILFLLVFVAVIIILVVAISTFHTVM